ncbi:MAG: (deoxy)nucleoside triphosphate pyrophosphohydrolase [Desulfovibrio sp.]|jgi:8-oxo-dGTP diphosphatase|nr:(deoxy)nucleoside triphosphate pyrophosphohydrolase [Mailhella sp.]
MGFVTKKVMAGVLRQDGCVLIMRRAPFMSWAGSWEFPGGKLEQGESHEECLRRELEEELGIRATVGELLAENRHGYDFGEVLLSVYEVTSWDGEITLTVHDDMRWVPIHALEEFPGLLPADVPIARALKEKSKKSS